MGGHNFRCSVYKAFIYFEKRKLSFFYILNTFNFNCNNVSVVIFRLILQTIHEVCCFLWKWCKIQEKNLMPEVCNQWFGSVLVLTAEPDSAVLCTLRSLLRYFFSSWLSGVMHTTELLKNSKTRRNRKRIWKYFRLLIRDPDGFESSNHEKNRGKISRDKLPLSAYI